MQNDLISRSALIKQLDDDIKITEYFMGKNPKDSEKYATLLNQSIVLRNYKAIIEDMPTAYDVEKVVEQIDGMFGVDPMYYGEDAKWAVDKAIEIVRNGGKE